MSFLQLKKFSAKGNPIPEKNEEAARQLRSLFFGFNQPHNLISTTRADPFQNEAVILHLPFPQFHENALETISTPDRFQDLELCPRRNLLPPNTRLWRELGRLTLLYDCFSQPFLFGDCSAKMDHSHDSIRSRAIRIEMTLLVFLPTPTPARIIAAWFIPWRLFDVAIAQRIEGSIYLAQNIAFPHSPPPPPARSCVFRQSSPYDSITLRESWKLRSHRASGLSQQQPACDFSSRPGIR